MDVPHSTQWPATLPIFQSTPLTPSHLSNVNQRSANFGLTTCHRTWSTTHLWTFATLRYSSIWEPIYTGNKWCTKWSETVPRTIPTGWDRCQWTKYWSCAFIEDFRPLTRVDRRHFVRYWLRRNHFDASEVDLRDSWLARKNIARDQEIGNIGLRCYHD